MKDKKRVHLLIAAVALIIFLVGCGITQLYAMRYYYCNKYNVLARRAALSRLNEIYCQEFELLSTEFETTETGTGQGHYVHMWTYRLQDSQGKQFYTYVRLYGEREKGDGVFYATDYLSYVDDTYGQLCIEEILGNKYDLHKYRQEKVNCFPDRKDYIFVYTKDNADEIARILTEIYFKETEFSTGCCLRCRVNNEDGEELFSYFWSSVTRNLQKQNKEITKETVYAYILQEIQN